MKYYFVILSCFLLNTPLISSASDVPGEEKIRADIKKKADQSKWDKYFRDSTPDGERELVAELNTAVLLSNRTKRRVGIFESYAKGQRKIYEVRFFSQDLILDWRYKSNGYADRCADGPVLYASDVESSYVFIGVKCKGKDGDTLHDAYIWHEGSGGLYFIHSDSYDWNRNLSIRYGSGLFNVKFKYNQADNPARKISTSINFKIIRGKNGWEVKDLPGTNEEWGGVGVMERFPVDHKYDLPEEYTRWR
ncbi:hypothetical protein HNQ59_003921 [Chitinivorax tropicus]|uniref:Uncharacterized protein n=1 Tax=Chitinivorax tropicus TaxID=714531 RepID=A0A840MW98_9PROT|nr:hypothetical protein [Chitinivorax tropicus]MBB5020596.1 hypothetical protein [Chitinivorax tropicus]